MFLKAEVRTDSNATLGICMRHGIGGKARHIRTQHLWIQDAIADGLKVSKVPGKKNCADMLTKHLGSEELWRYMYELGFSDIGGRASKACKLS